MNKFDAILKTLSEVLTIFCIISVVIIGSLFDVAMMGVIVFGLLCLLFIGLFAWVISDELYRRYEYHRDN